MNISFFSTSKVVHFSKFVFVQSFLFNSIDGEIFNDVQVPMDQGRLISLWMLFRHYHLCSTLPDVLPNHCLFVMNKSLFSAQL